MASGRPSTKDYLFMARIYVGIACGACLVELGSYPRYYWPCLAILIPSFIAAGYNYWRAGEL